MSIETVRAGINNLRVVTSDCAYPDAAMGLETAKALPSLALLLLPKGFTERRFNQSALQQPPQDLLPQYEWQA